MLKNCEKKSSIIDKVDSFGETPLVIFLFFYFFLNY